MIFKTIESYSQIEYIQRAMYTKLGDCSHLTNKTKNDIVPIMIMVRPINRIQINRSSNSLRFFSELR